MPENLISYGSRYFLEENSLIDAVVFVHLRLERKTCCLPSKKFLLAIKTSLVSFYLPIFICCGKDQGGKVRDQRSQDKLKLGKISTQIPIKGLVAPKYFLK